MKLLKQILDFYIDASIHVALAVYAMARVTMINFHLPYDENVCLALFFGTIVAYNFLKYAGGAESYLIVRDHHIQIIQGFSFCCFAIAVFFILRLHGETLFWFLVMGVVTFLYLVPFWFARKNLRTLEGLKIYIVAIVWAISTVMLPVENSSMYINSSVIIEGVQRFLFVLVLMFPFEIRDLKVDSPLLNTIPQQLGVRKTRILGVALLFPLYFLEFFKEEVNPVNLIVLPVICLLVMLAIIFSGRGKNKYYTAFWVEGIPVLWWLLLLL